MTDKLDPGLKMLLPMKGVCNVESYCRLRHSSKVGANGIGRSMIQQRVMAMVTGIIRLVV